MSDQKKQFYIATAVSIGIFSLSAVMSREWILLPFGFLPPLALWLVNGMRVDTPYDRIPEIKKETHPDEELSTLDPDAQIEEANRRLKADSQDTSAYLMRGLAHYKKREYNDALGDFNVATFQRPMIALPHIYRSNIALQQNDIDGAYRETLLAVRKEPFSAIVFAHRCMIFLLKEQPKKALEDAWTAMRLNPELPVSRLSVALSQWQNGDKSEALRYWKMLPAHLKDADQLRDLQFPPAIIDLVQAINQADTPMSLG
ncbi:hypothetical protein MASR2M15_25960 [Anaerolineales bacterium]